MTELTSRLRKSKDGKQKVSGSKCRRRSTAVGGTVGSPDTISKDGSLTKQTSSVFNQLPPSRLERVFGRRTALFPGVEGEEPNPPSEISVTLMGGGSSASTRGFRILGENRNTLK